MCGIAGIWGFRNKARIRPTLTRMLEVISHRGPDGQGMMLFEQAALGHVRLSVIDLEGGAQPMSSADGKLHITYNGELYNFHDLRKKLRASGRSFRTKSDTEVVLQSYQEYGVESFSMFRGMFAFAIWDSERQEGILVRDRFGIKPLFYSIDQGILLFASEVKGLIKAMASQPTIDLNSLHQLLNFRYIPGDNTLFADILHLPPGHYLKWNKDGFRQIKWQPEQLAGRHDCEIVSIQQALRQAVDRQLVSDVPLGGYLSAGLDSATILALALERFGPGREYPTFTIQTGDSPLEAIGATKTAEYFQVQNYQEPISFDMETILPRLIYHLEMPKINALQTALLARLARKHVKVVLSGLGADEIFLGYTTHRYLANLDAWSHGPRKHLAKLAGNIAAFCLPALGLQYEEWRRGGQMLQSLPDFMTIYGILKNIWDSPIERQRIYGQKMLNADLHNSFDTLRNSWPQGEDPVTAAAAYEIKQKMVNDFLLPEDRLSMAFGLEVRVPFLDEDLVDLVSAIDRHKRIPNGKSKYLMRQCVSKWLPEEILARPKSGFQVPIHEFFNTHLRPMATKYLNRERLYEDGLFNPAFVEQILAAKPHKRLRWHYFMLYLMIGTTIWLDIFQRGKQVQGWSIDK